ncbi:MAG: hypothetical protein OIF50_13995 [Flavobacteriaceae bacterium]|nr:hypothetical protein [Flavobacteriaceae bacterium]
MNKTALDLSKRIEEMFLNGSWIANTNYRKTLEGVDFEKATSPGPTGKNILQLVFHIIIMWKAYWVYCKVAR